MYDDGEEEDEEDEEDEERAGGDDSEDLYESDVSLAEDMDEQEEEAERAGGAAASDRDAGAWVRAARRFWSRASWRSRGARAQEAGPAGGGARGAPALRRAPEFDEEEEEEEEEGEEASYDEEDEEFGDDDDDDALLAAEGLRRRQEAGASAWGARCRGCAARLTTSGAQAHSLHDNARCKHPPATRRRQTRQRHGSGSARRVRCSLPRAKPRC